MYKTLSIVIPAYNEEPRLTGTLENLSNYLWGYTKYPLEIIVVDNGSKDFTPWIVREMQYKLPLEIKLVSLNIASKALAITEGVKVARGKYILTMDADLAMPPNEIPKFMLYALSGKYEIVIGSRYIPGARVTQKRIRKLTGRVFALLAGLVVPGIHDTQCGFKLYDAEIAKKLYLENTTVGYAFDVEILALALAHGYRIKEIPIIWNDQAGGKVDLLRDPFTMAGDLFRIYKKMRALGPIPVEIAA